MTANGTLKRVLNKHQQTKPTKAQTITYSSGEKERKDRGKLMPSDLRPLIARDVEDYLKAGGKITIVPTGTSSIVEY